MEKLILKVKNTFFTVQFMKFILIGIINTFTGTIFSIIYSTLFNSTVAFICGYATGLVVSYTLNSIFTFKERLDLKKFIKFAIASMPNFLIQFICVLIIMNILGFDKIIAYGLAAVIGVPVTFILMKVFTFKK